MKNDYLKEQYLLSTTTRRNSNKEIDQSLRSMWSQNCSKSFLKLGAFNFLFSCLKDLFVLPCGNPSTSSGPYFTVSWRKQKGNWNHNSKVKNSLKFLICLPLPLSTRFLSFSPKTRSLCQKRLLYEILLSHSPSTWQMVPRWSPQILVIFGYYVHFYKMRISWKFQFNILSGLEVMSIWR